MTKVFPVIHHLDDELGIEQAMIAHSMGADGVFLISHHGKDLNLGILGVKIKALMPDLKIGINMLNHDISYSAKIVRHLGLDMVWADYCGVSSEGYNEEAVYLSNWLKENPDIELFASVAFKYQKEDKEPAKAAMNAKKLGFIPTTSGEATGHAPSIEKIQLMSESVSGNLAIASGMTVENIHLFKPYLSHVLVSTGISLDDYRFDKNKLDMFMKKIK